MRRKQTPVELEETPCLGRKQTLVTEVVHGDQGPEICETRITFRLRLQEHDCKSSLPVVHVEKIGRIDPAHQFKSRATEKRKSFSIVRIVAFGTAVEMIAIE